MKVHCLCSQPSYAAHLAPVWHGLDPELRGRWYAVGLCADLGNVEGVPGWARGYPKGDGLTLVAGYADEAVVPGPVIYLEHGAGQTYRGDPGDPVTADHESYSGSPGHDRVVLFLCPSVTVAARWRARYPAAGVAVVGCPKLDWWHRHPRSAYASDRSPVLAVTFHSDNRLCPETRGAWPHYRDGLALAVRRLQGDGWTVLGHGHPRLWQPLRTFWGGIGVEAVADFGEVLGRADVLAVDNSSTMYEFASVGGPVVALNAPWFRRHVQHGLRFWDLIPGEQIEAADQLPAAAARALVNPPEARAARAEVVRRVYLTTDGKATKLAVDAITVAVQARA